jgi:enoyl-CoA hydratase
MAGQVVVERADAIATLVLSNPDKRNCLDFPLLAALAREATALAADPSLAALVLRGAGDKAFCAGADFDAFSIPEGLEAGVAAMEAALNEAVAALEGISVPIVAALSGACFGAGVQIALAADIRIAGADCRFGIPAAQIGMPYPLAAIGRLVSLMGAGGAAHTLLTAEPFDAATALRRRLIDEVVAEGALAARAQALATAMASFPPPAIRAYKAVIKGLAAQPLPESVVAAHRSLAESRLYVAPLKAVAAKRAGKAR